MPECDNCGGHVSRRYYRVRKGNDGALHGCPACANPATRERLAAGVETDYVARSGPNGEAVASDD